MPELDFTDLDVRNLDTRVDDIAAEPLVAQQQLNEQALSRSIVQGLEADPDTVAADSELARQLGLPHGAVSEDTRPELQKQQRQRDIEDKTRTSPVLKDFLTLDTDNLASSIAHDDIDSLANVEKMSKDLTFAGSFSRGVDLLQGLGFRAVEATGEVLDAEGLTSFGAEGAELNLAEAAAHGERKQFVDIETADDFAQWLKETGGEQIPLMAPSLAAGAAGAALGTAILPGVGTVLGGALGAFIPSFILGVGETQQAIKERDPNTVAPGAAFGSGALIALLDSALPGKVGGKLVKAFGREAAEKAVALTATRIARRAATQGLQGLALEGVTEAVQEVISEVAAAQATDTEVNAEELTAQMIEAFATGAFLGGGTTIATSVTSDVIAARRRKTAMDAIDKQIKGSKLNKRAPGKMAEFATASMREAGVDEVSVPLEVVLRYANEHPTLLAPEALARLNIADRSLEDAILADTAGGPGGTNVNIPIAAFTKEVLGTEGYALFSPHMTLNPEDVSFSAAAEAVIAREETPAELQTALDKADVSEELKAQTQETLAKLKPGAAAVAVDEATPEVRAVLMSLIQDVEARKSTVTQDIKAGRVEQLDTDIDVQDRTIVEIQDEIDQREQANEALPPSKQQPTARLEARLAKLVEARDASVAEQTLLASDVEETPAVAKDTQKKLRRKPVKVKARVLADLDVQITKESIRATRAAFRAALKASDTLAQQKKEITKAINQLPISQAQKKLLAARIQNTKTAARLNKVAGEVQARATVLAENTRRTEIKKAVQKVLKRSKPKSKSGQKVGGDADIEAVLANARDIAKKSVGEAKVELETALASQEPPAAQLFQRRLLALTANSPLLNTADAENLLLDLNALAEGNRGAALARATGKREVAAERVEFAIEATTQGKNIAVAKTTGLVNKLKRSRKKIEAYLTGTASGWDDVLDIVFNKKDVDAAEFVKSMRMTDVIQDFKSRVVKWEQQYIQTGLDAFQLDTYQQLQERFLDDTDRKDFGLFGNARGEVVRLEYTRAEIRKLWMEEQDPTLAKVISAEKGMAYTEEMLRTLFDTLTEQDYAFARAQLDFYRRLYPQVNAVYRRVYGVDLPFNEFYSPIQRDQGKTTTATDQYGRDIVQTDEVSFRRQIAQQLKERTPNLHPLMQRNDVGAMQRYLHDMAWFATTAERVQEVKAVFTDPRLLDTISKVHTPAMSKLIGGFLEDYGTGYAARGTIAEAWFGYANRALTGANLPLKLSIGTKQLMSYWAMMDSVPAKDFLSSHADFFKSPKSAKKIIRFLYENSGTLQKRGSSLEFELARIDRMEDSVFRWKKQNLWEQWRFAFIRYGDRFPIYAGGWAVYKNAVKEGKSHTEAMRAFEDALNTTQQSNDLDKMSQLQRMGAMGRTLTLFMTARLSLYRAEARAWRQRPKALGGRGKISAAEFGKRMAYYHFAIPMLIQFVASGFRWDTDQQIVAGVLGQLNTVVIFGDIMTWATVEMLEATGAIEETANRSPDTGALALATLVAEAVEGAVAAASAEDLEELWDATKDLGGSVSALFGQPGAQVINAAEGVADIEEGEVEKGLLRIFGLSEKTAEKAGDADFIE